MIQRPGIPCVYQDPDTLRWFGFTASGHFLTWRLWRDAFAYATGQYPS